MSYSHITTVRGCVEGLSRVLEQTANDPLKDQEGFKAALSGLVGRHREVFESCFPRPTDMRHSRVLYFDPGLLLVLSEVGPSFIGPPHNHWAWNALFVCEGSMHFQWYARTDDQQQSGKAELTLREDKVVGVGEVGIVGKPPEDIHAFEILEESTWLLTVSRRPENAVREFYDLATNSYELTTFEEIRRRKAALGAS